MSKAKVQFYSNLQNEFYDKLTDIFKALLKKDTKQDLFEWSYGTLAANMNKTKLGARLENANNEADSHDGLLVNAYACFMNLCKAIMAKKDEKYRSIDPSYFMHSPYLGAMRYDPINGKPYGKQYPPKEFGTIT